MSAQTSAVTQPVSPPPPVARSTPLIVIVAPTLEERLDFLTHLDPSTPVLIAPSVAVAQRLMRPPAAQGTAAVAAPAAPAGHWPGDDSVLTDDPVTRVRVHEDRRTVGFGSVEVSLTPLEFALLRLLMAEPGRVWRFDELVRRVWGTEHLGDASQVHAVVKRLRAKLTREHAPVAIEAVRGVGFRAVRAPVGAAGERAYRVAPGS